MRTEYTLKTLGLTALVTATPTLAFGHAGHHGESGLLAALQHVAQSPYHLALFGLPVVAAVFGAIVLFRRLKAHRGN